MQKENNLTVGQWSVHWFTTNRQKWNGNTEGGYRNLIYSHIIRYNAAKGYEGIIEHHIIPAIGAIKLKQLSSIHIQRMYNDLACPCGAAGGAEAGGERAAQAQRWERVFWRSLRSGFWTRECPQRKLRMLWRKRRKNRCGGTGGHPQIP